MKTGKYDDIIDRDPPISTKHKPMTRENRAAQFAPFAALTGYGAAVREAERLTDRKIDLGQDRIDEINRALQRIAESERVTATVAWFCPDERKAGGAYRSMTGAVKSLDPYTRRLCMENGTTVSVEDILMLELADGNE